MRFAKPCLLVIVGGVFAAAPARAHVAPAASENNRYIKVLPFVDRVRIAYTVFYGEAPGRALRQTLDADHDGVISDSEARAYGDQLGAQIAPRLTLEVDGVAQPLTWGEISVGLGMPQTTAGAWSVDLIAWPCSAGRGAPARHHVVLRDRYDLPIAGETEIWVTDMPGVQIEHARIGAMDDPAHDFQFSGPPTALGSDGLDLVYTATARASGGSGGACQAAPEAAPPRREGPGAVIGGAVGGAVLGLGAMALRRRRRRAGVLPPTA